MPNKILVVDDSITVRQQVGQTLTRAGFVVIEAVDGADALAKLRANDGISLVVCDIHMPRMDGLEMLEQLSKQPKQPPPPVLMLTTEGEPELINRAKKAGAKGWIVKPFKPELLVAAAKKITQAC